MELKDLKSIVKKNAKKRDNPQFENMEITVNYVSRASSTKTGLLRSKLATDELGPLYVLKDAISGKLSNGEHDSTKVKISGWIYVNDSGKEFINVTDVVAEADDVYDKIEFAASKGATLTF